MPGTVRRVARRYARAGATAFTLGLNPPGSASSVIDIRDWALLSAQSIRYRDPPGCCLLDRDFALLSVWSVCSSQSALKMALENPCCRPWDRIANHLPDRRQHRASIPLNMRTDRPLDQPLDWERFQDAHMVSQ